MEEKKCVVQEAIDLIPPTLNAVEEDSRETLTRIHRLLLEIRGGTGLTGHPAAVRSLAGTLKNGGREMQHLATSLLALLEANESEFLNHAEHRCSVDRCFGYQPPPCQSACPAHIDIPTFVALIGQGRYEEATDVILKDMPFPWACGLVCPHPCEDACLRREMDDPVSIQLMKAYAAKMAVERRGYRKPQLPEKRPEKVAVVGSGPAGLSAAYFLTLKGYGVTVFEKLSHAGGMLRFGIPAYRLPKDFLDTEIRHIKDIGVEIRTGVIFGSDVTLDSLRAEGFSAFYFAVGLGLSRKLGVEGEALDGVLGGVDFLRASALGDNMGIGRRVLVVGGGNVAIDVARTALRMGGEQVQLVCLEQCHEMPAWKQEVRDAQEEGVVIHDSWGPRRLLGRNGRVAGLELKCCSSVFDNECRFNPCYDESRLNELEADTVILAIGQGAETDFAKGAGLELGPGNGIKADPVTGATNLPGVYAGGDVVHGPRIVVDAVAAGKRTAVAIDCYLRNVPFPDRICPPQSRGIADFIETTAATKTSTGRSHPPILPVETRIQDFRQAEPGLTDAMAAAEANRCLRCDRCLGDGICMLVCREMGANALNLSPTKKDRLAFLKFGEAGEKCIGCGSCAAACPEGNIVVTDRGYTRRIIFCGTLMAELPLEHCECCGTPYATKAYLELVRRRADAASGVPLDQNLCPACARTTRAERIAGDIAPF